MDSVITLLNNWGLVSCCELLIPGKRFWNSCQWNLDSVSTIPDSLTLITGSKVQDSDFHKPKFSCSELHVQNFPGFRNQDYPTWGKLDPL